MPVNKNEIGLQNIRHTLASLLKFTWVSNNGLLMVLSIHGDIILVNMTVTVVFSRDSTTVEMNSSSLVT